MSLEDKNSSVAALLTQDDDEDNQAQGVDTSQGFEDGNAFHVSPRKDATVLWNIKETSNHDVTINESNVDTNIDSGEPIITWLPKKTVVTPPEGLIFMSNMEEGRSSKITQNLSNKDPNVTIGEENSTSVIDNSTVPPPPPSSPLPTSTITPTTVPAVSPTFQGIINERIASLFSSQSEDEEMPYNEEEDDEMVQFDVLEFDHAEENVDDNANKSGKQYKILNSKLNTILQFWNNNAGKSSVSS
ncbi:unnamed protein product [Lactuca virosa]|uniref:Uncharacterized protein n=1 Tax=Lactuca virosa TaxID=75947 RepID=A0AAU9PM97_9ASTR|nr:unnamed protein product [Lactuca virosa]